MRIAMGRICSAVVVVFLIAGCRGNSGNSGNSGTNGSAYNTTVLTQPSGQTCTVSTGAGIVSGSNVTNVAVVCATDTYSVGGSVTGLTGGTVVLQDNGGDNLTVSADGAFTFPTKLTNSSAYNTTVLTQPSGQTCTVS